MLRPRSTGGPDREVGTVESFSNITEKDQIMGNRIAALLIAGTAVTGLLIGAGEAGARRGADDPAGHIRQSQGADDATTSSAPTASTTSGQNRRGAGAAESRRKGRNPNKGGV
ncbi:MAG: hypothetical protein KIH64_006035 [Mycobacterium sp.]|nr:hypothetical protein [Mycobacterium sp.]